MSDHSLTAGLFRTRSCPRVISHLIFSITQPSIFFSDSVLDRAVKFNKTENYSVSMPDTGLRNGNSSGLKCLGRTLCGIDTLVYTLHENMKVNFFGTCPT